MKGLAEIRSDNARAAANGRARKRQPHTFFDEDEVTAFFDGPLEFPYFGSYVPAGWVLERTLFCDASGVGGSHERALTKGELERAIKHHVKCGHEYGYAIVEVGQFQIYLGLFRKAKRA